MKRILSFMLALSLVIGLLPVNSFAHDQDDSGKTYKLYPIPQSIEYDGKSYILKKKVNVVYDEEIDEATKQRLVEILELKDLEAVESDRFEENALNIFVGVYGSSGPASKFIEKEYEIDSVLFDNIDAYYLNNRDNIISILGRDTDSSFYGLTTLYHVFKQMDGLTIQNFEVQDYADIESRGYIEGYYGNPWSTEDRVRLMEWSGYYKLNSYFYAPKDDPKHNSDWRSLYSEEEIENKIKPLAEAGNKSKTRFVYALHPYMHNPIRYSSEQVYQEDLKVMQAKFRQVIDAGVRQIAILADDAGNVGGQNYIRTLEDMTEWLKELQKEYPDLKLTLPFVTQEYMGWGEDYYSEMPENVQIVMTGGRVWGEVSKEFTEAFTEKVGFGPYMWINWPCTDNSKNHLIMGGYKDFLHPGVNPKNIEGIVLNPMQQSEPSKVAIFGNATYSWNIWESGKIADKAWEDSFSFVDNNSAIPTKASDALREISKHMINQNMDSRVRVLEESVELRELLTPIRQKLNNNTITEDDFEQIDEIIHEFEILREAADYYKHNAGDSNIRDQIIYWLRSWNDTMEAGISYLKGVKAAVLGDDISVVSYNTKGEVAFERSRSHGFDYVGNTEYAEVGVQHIVPFIRSLASYVSAYAEVAMDPSKVTKTFITNRVDNPVGSVDNVFDNNESTHVSYRNPVWIYEGDYVGVKFNKLIDVNNIRFLLGNGKNHFEHSKLQYSKDGNEWKDIELQGMKNEFIGVRGEYLDVKVEQENLPEDFKAMGIRLIATQDNVLDAYLNVHLIQINHYTDADKGSTIHDYSVTTEGMSYQSGSEANLKDGNPSSEAWFANEPYSGPNRDKVLKDAKLIFTFDNPKTINKFTMYQGQSANLDVYTRAVLEYQLDGKEEWLEAGLINGEQKIELDLDTITNVKKMRIRNLEDSYGWIRIGGVIFEEVKQFKDQSNVCTNLIDAEVYSDKDEGKVFLRGSELVLNKNDYIGVTLDNVYEITSVETGSLDESMVLETAIHPEIWSEYDSDSTDAKYIRVRALDNNNTFDPNKFVVYYHQIGEKKVESDFRIENPSGDMRNIKNGVDRVFDGDLSTVGMITGPQEKGKEIIFDLGQNIEVNSIRYYIPENNLNYPRAASFYLSKSKEKDAERHKVLHIGPEDDEIIDNTWDSTTAKDYDQYLTHDSVNPGNMYAEARNLDVEGRYIIVTPTQTYSHRWFGFGEIVINDGEYISNESSKDVITGAIEDPGKVPSNMFDGDFTTTYKSSESNSFFNYRLTQGNQRTIRIIQTGIASNANVTADIFINSKIENIHLGQLNQTINEFSIPREAQFVSITVEWGEDIPEIAQIMTYDKARDAVDKSKLEDLVENLEDTSTWTDSTKQEYENVIEVAESILKSDYVTQNIIDNIVLSITTTINNKKLKGDTKILESIINNRLKQVVDGITIYTTRTFAAYESAIQKIEMALEDRGNISDEDVAILHDQYEEALNNLTYSPIERELAELSLILESILDERHYTEASYAKYLDKKYELQNLVDLDKQGESSTINPSDINLAHKLYKDAIKELVIISELNELMDLEFNPDNYTKQSWQNYIDSLDNAKKVIKDGTQEEVNEATEILRNAIESLVIYEDADIRDVIEEMKLIREEDYTEKSYRELQDAIEKAIKDLELKNPEINRSNIQEMLNKRNGLVNVRSLKEMIHKAEKYDSELYTRDSYNKLEQSLLEANDNIINGSKESVEKALENLETAINGLVQNADELEDYRNTIVLKNPEIYTEETYKAYLEAYEAIMELEIGNTPKQEFQKLKEEFEIARDSLIIKRADYSRLEETLSKVPVDLSIYTNESVAKLEKLLDSIDYDLDITQQDKLDKLVNEIDKAISDLVAIPLDDDKDNGKDTEKPKEPETPKEPTKPGEPEEPTDVEPEQDKDKLPKTGETLFNMASVGIGLLLIALIMVKNRKRADYKNMDK